MLRGCFASVTPLSRRIRHVRPSRCSLSPAHAAVLLPLTDPEIEVPGVSGWRHAATILPVAMSCQRRAPTPARHARMFHGTQRRARPSWSEETRQRQARHANAGLRRAYVTHTERCRQRVAAHGTISTDKSPRHAAAAATIEHPSTRENPRRGNRGVG